MGMSTSPDAGRSAGTSGSPGARSACTVTLAASYDDPFECVRSYGPSLSADEPEISVIIRARDEAASIGRCLALLAAQGTAGGVEAIVVDSGSRDATTEIARDRGARVIALHPPP